MQVNLSELLSANCFHLSSTCVTGYHDICCLNNVIPFLCLCCLSSIMVLICLSVCVHVYVCACLEEEFSNQVMVPKHSLAMENGWPSVCVFV